MATLSVKDYKALLDADQEGRAEQIDADLNSNIGKGACFEHYVAETLISNERSIDTEIDDASIGGWGSHSDLGVDVLLEDSANEKFIVVDAKFRSFNKNPTAQADEELVAFLERPWSLSDKEFIRTHGSSDAQEKLSAYADAMQKGWSAEFRFITTCKDSDRIQACLERTRARIKKEGLKVTVSFVGISALKDLHASRQSLEAAIPATSSFKIQEGKRFEIEEPYHTLICVVKGNELRDLYRRDGHKEALYTFNIRGYLGSRGINQQIIETAENAPHDFLYLNNGISAICTGFNLEGNEVTARKMQIVNGAQTVTALTRAEPNDDVYVMLRLVHTQTTSSTDGFNERLIRANNSQNQMKVSDFRSNDPIQVFLRANLQQKHSRKHLKAFYYEPTRKEKKGTGKRLTLEQLAKIRYSYLHGPIAVHGDPKSLWTLDSNYEQAFGIDGELKELWSEIELSETLFACALFEVIEERAKALASSDPKLSLAKRLKFHTLALMGEEARRRLDTGQRAELGDSADKFFEFFVPSYEVIQPIIVTEIAEATEKGLSNFALVRNQERWASMANHAELQSIAKSVG